MKKTKLLLSLLAFMMVGIMNAGIINSGTLRNDGDNIKWTLDDGGILSIEGCGEMVLPLNSSGKEVAPWDSNRLEISKIIINEGIRNIPRYSFQGCTNLTSVEIKEGVAIIDDRAFYNCQKLSSVYLPSSIETISTNAFSGCTSLPIIDGIRYADTFLSEIVDKTHESYNIKEGTTIINDGAFSNCKNIKSINFPNSVTCIGGGAFSGCTNLEFVSMSKNVKKIGDSAFEGCHLLPVIDNLRYAGMYLVEAVDKTCETYKIQEGTLTIGYRAFNGCKNLKSIVIPNSVNNINAYAFSGCSSLTSVTIPNSVTRIEESTFSHCSALTSVVIPNSVTIIGLSSFAYCSSLTSFVIPNSTTYIAQYAFENCTGLTSVTIGNSLGYISSDYSSGTFAGCTNVKELVFADGCSTIIRTGLTSLCHVYIPNSASKIEARAFEYCANLNSITLCPNIREIGEQAFNGCSSLNEIICKSEKVPIVGDKCFDGTGYINGTLYVKKDLLNTYSSAFPWYGWGTILSIEDENPDAEKCATPEIAFNDNKLSFSCATEGVEYHYTITPEGANDEMTTSGDVDLTNMIVSVYATATGKSKSDTATQQVQCVREQIVTKEVEKIVEIYIYNDTPLSIDIAEGQSISLRITDGIIHIENAPHNSTINVYDIKGESLMNQRVLDEDVAIKLPRNATYIIKVGEKTFKVKI